MPGVAAVSGTRPAAAVAVDGQAAVAVTVLELLLLMEAAQTFSSLYMSPQQHQGIYPHNTSVRWGVAAASISLKRKLLYRKIKGF